MEKRLSNVICFLIILLTVSSCDPGYICLLNNKTKDSISINVRPAIEDFYKGDYREFLISRKIIIKDSISTYIMTPTEALKLYSYIGFKPDEKHFPYNYLEIIIHNKHDTIRFTNKKAILDAFKRSKTTYFIEII